MKNENLMASVPEEAKCLHGEGSVEQQIRDEHDEPPASKLADYTSERRFRCGTLTCTNSGKRRQQLVPVTEAGSRWHHRADIVVESYEAGGITLPDQHQTKGGYEPLRIRDLREYRGW